MKRSLVRITVMALAVVLIFTLMIGPGLLAAPIALLIGWEPSFARLFKAWHPSANAVVLFALATIVLVAGAHIFLQWLFACLRGAQASTLPPKWPWKWTLCGFGIIFCALLAVCSLVLTTHQLYWIFQSSDPLFTDPFRERFRTLYVAKTLQPQVEEVVWDGLKARAAFLRAESRPGEPASEAIQPVWIEQDQRRLRAIVLIPRRPMHRARATLTIIQPGTNLITRNLDDLPEVLASFGIGGSSQSSKGSTQLLP